MTQSKWENTIFLHRYSFFGCIALACAPLQCSSILMLCYTAVQYSLVNRSVLFFRQLTENVYGKCAREILGDFGVR